MKEYKWYKDWLNWFYYIGIGIILMEFFNYYDTLIRWKWGYWSIDLIPAVILLFVITVVHFWVISERRWKAFKKLRDSQPHGGMK